MTAAYVEGNYAVVASNVFRTHPLSVRYGSRFGYIHAEHNVLRHIKDGSKGTVYIYREHANGTMGYSRPCSGCLRLLRDVGVRTIVYSEENSYVKERLTRSY